MGYGIFSNCVKLSSAPSIKNDHFLNPIVIFVFRETNESCTSYREAPARSIQVVRSCEVPWWILSGIYIITLICFFLDDQINKLAEIISQNLPIYSTHSNATLSPSNNNRSENRSATGVHFACRWSQCCFVGWNRGRMISVV